MKIIKQTISLTLIFLANSAFAVVSGGGGPVLIEHAELQQRDFTTPGEFDFIDQFAGISDITTRDFATAANPNTNPFVSMSIDLIESGNIDGFKALADEVNSALGIAGTVTPNTFIDNVMALDVYDSTDALRAASIAENPEVNATAFAKMVSDIDFNSSEENAAIVEFEPVSFQEAHEQIEELYLKALDSL